MMRSVLFLTATAGFVCGLFFLKFEQFAYAGSFESPERPGEAVRVAEVTSRAVEQEIRAAGTVVARQTVAISAASPGIVSEVRFRSGQLVQAGQVLLTQDTRVERARLKEAEARRRLAERIVKRTRSLRDKGTVAATRLEREQADLDVARAQVAALRAEIGLKSIRAPFAGRLGIRSVEVGAWLTPGQQVADLVADTGLFVDFQIPQSVAGALDEGARIRLTHPGATSPSTATVHTIAPSFSTRSRSVTVRALLEEPAEGLRPGMFVDVGLVIQREPTLLIPTTAVRHTPDGAHVFVVTTTPERGDIALMRLVKTGAARGDLVSIREGLKAGEQVVVQGGFKLYEGARVAVQQAPLPGVQPELLDE